MTPRVLYLPLNSAEVIQQGMYDAFEKAKVELHIYDFIRGSQKRGTRNAREELVSKVRTLKPDLMHMQLQFTSVIDANTIKRCKEVSSNTVITNWSGDVRSNVPKIYIDVAQHADISLISSTGQLDMYRKLARGRDIRYWQIGYNPKLYYPKFSNTFQYDAVFAASNHRTANFPGHKTREAAVNVLFRNFNNRFGLFGYGWNKYRGTRYVHQGQVNNVYNNSVSCISVSNFNDLSHYFSDRLLMCMASGRPTVSFRFPGWESYFTDNTDICIAENVEEIAAKVSWLKANPKIADEIGRNGARKVAAEHTYYCRVKELLDMVGL